MPVGSPNTILPIIVDIKTRDRRRVLDLGCGLGIWGAMFRNYVECGERESTLVLVEAFNEYENPNWLHYDDRYHTDLRRYIAKYPDHRFDVVLMNDVIEHFNKDEGIEILKTLKTGKLVPGGVLYVSTPVRFIEQGAVYGNEYERHISHWTAEDFEALGFTIIPDGGNESCERMLIARYVDVPRKKQRTKPVSEFESISLIPAPPPEQPPEVTT